MSFFVYFPIFLHCFQARELVDGQPGNDNLTTATTKALITIHDVNDSPPTFNKKNYYISLTENTPTGTPLPIDIHVHDPDVVSKSNEISSQPKIFSLFF